MLWLSRLGVCFDRFEGGYGRLGYCFSRFKGNFGRLGMLIKKRLPFKRVLIQNTNSFFLISKLKAIYAMNEKTIGNVTVCTPSRNPFASL
jgi:hypothetical protein